MEPDGQMVTMMDSGMTMDLMDLTKNDEPLKTDASILLKR